MTTGCSASVLPNPLKGTAMSSPSLYSARTRAKLNRKRQRANARAQKRALLQRFAPVMIATEARAS